MGLLQQPHEVFDTPPQTVPVRPRNNPRFDSFRQAQFTAGDVFQFNECREPVQLSADNVRSSLPFHLEFPTQVYWERYRQLEPQDVSNTFHYIFEKFKKGIFVQIKDNAIRVFLPFSNHAFTNEWSHLVHVDPTVHPTIQSVFRAATERAGHVFRDGAINRYANRWYGNNGLLRYEYPVHEGDSGVSICYHMLSELCARRSVPDCEFFLNRRDFPILRTDGSEAYTNFFGQGHPLVSHAYARYVPILSMCSQVHYADVPIPNWEDWSRVVQERGIYFTHTTYIGAHGQMGETDDGLVWESRKPIAVFRGSSTGIGTTLETNMRLYVAQLATQPENRDATDGRHFLDAGITKWNTRPRMLRGGFVDTINPGTLRTVAPLSYAQQAEFKYIVHIDGHSAAFRLSHELSLGSVVLYVQSAYQLWFTQWLQPWIHYVPVKADCSDLLDRIRWCKAHDAHCKEIAEHARAFWKEHLSEDRMLDFLQSALVRLKTTTGTYAQPHYRVSDMQFARQDALVCAYQANHLNLVRIHAPDTLSEVHDITSEEYRSVQRFQALQWLMWMYPNVASAAARSPLFESAKCMIETMQITPSDRVLSKKQTTPRTNELMHEYFVGLMAVNPMLRHIPNFRWTFAVDDGVCYQEAIVGTTLFTYLESNAFDVRAFVHLLYQIALALHHAQQACAFVHWDLRPWNVLLQTLRTKKTVQYYSNGYQYTELDTDLVPILIDYETAHVIVDGVAYANTKIFSPDEDLCDDAAMLAVRVGRFDGIHDILSLLITSLSKLLLRQLDKPTLTVVFKLTEFFSGTQYTDGKVFKNVADLRAFLERTRKFAVLSVKPKHELATRTTQDFIDFVQERFPWCNGQLVTQKRYVMQWGSPHEYLYKFTRGATRDSLAPPFFQDALRQCSAIDVTTLPPIDCLRLHNRLTVAYDNWRCGGKQHGDTARDADVLLKRMRTHIVKIDVAADNVRLVEEILDFLALCEANSGGCGNGQTRSAAMSNVSWRDLLKRRPLHMLLDGVVERTERAYSDTLG